MVRPVTELERNTEKSMVTDEGIYEAYYNCVKNKHHSLGAVKYFMRYQEDLLDLADEINARIYQPSTSTAFVVTNPKYREVFAACFRDRVVHHYIALRLEPLFEEIFGERTFNCRKGKGTLFGINMLQSDIRECSEGFTKDCYIAKLDLKGFFMSIDRELLDGMLTKFIKENYKGEDLDDVLWLSHSVIMNKPEENCVKHSPDRMWEMLPPEKSLFTNGDGLGMPIGNLTSQHFANFYLHPLDALLDELGFKYHGRYVDDFYIIHPDKEYLLKSLERIREFLKTELHLKLHRDKFYIQHYSKGVTFTGTIVKFDRLYPAKRVVGNFYSAIHRLNNCKEKNLEKYTESINSYLGMMIHTNSYAIRRKGLMRITDDTMKKLYIKGHFESIHVRNKYASQEKSDIFSW